MKTTLEIDEAVMRELKARAAREGRTMSELVETALRALGLASTLATMGRHQAFQERAAVGRGRRRRSRTAAAVAHSAHRTLRRRRA
jgi:hypothetical protein